MADTIAGGAYYGWVVANVPGIRPNSNRGNVLEWSWQWSSYRDIIFSMLSVAMGLCVDFGTQWFFRPHSPSTWLISRQWCTIARRRWLHFPCTPLVPLPFCATRCPHSRVRCYTSATDCPSTWRHPNQCCVIYKSGSGTQQEAYGERRANVEAARTRHSSRTFKVDHQGEQVHSGQSACLSTNRRNQVTTSGQREPPCNERPCHR